MRERNRTGRGGAAPGLAAAGLAVAAILICGGGAMAALEPRVVETRFPTEDVVVASVVLRSPGERADSSAAIQATIDEVARAGGGVVFLEAGRYRLERPITVREGAILRGDRPAPEGAKPGRVEGTVLMPVHGRGDESSPAAFTVERGTGICHLSIWYPEQDAARPVPYPWAVQGSEPNCGDNYAVTDVTLVNPWLGVRIGPEWNELHYLRNVCGTPLKKGVELDFCTDIGRLIDVDLRAEWWAESGLPGAPARGAALERLRAFLAENATGLDMGRSDWEYIYRLRVSGYAVGAEIRRGGKGDANAVMFGCELTDCRRALVLSSLNAIGLAVAGGELSGSLHAVHAPRSYNSTTQLNGVRIGGGGTQVMLEGGGLLTFQNCTFAGGRTGPAVSADSGSAWLVGCKVEGRGPHVRLGAGVRAARVIGCDFDGRAGIENLAEAGDVVVDDGKLDLARADLSVPEEPPLPKPATSRLFTVTDHGASEDAPDNTAAFAKALAAAARAGGGTVYVPAGRYRFRGELAVPTGVELRGIFDVPHHTQSAGSVLMPLGGAGREDGTPFIALKERSGLRGLTIWYPEQSAVDPKPYPWTVRGEGKGVWLTDVTCGNSWQGVDLASRPSDAHFVRYLAGCYWRRGLFVGECAGKGYVADVQFNPHYALRLPGRGLPHPDYGGRDAGGDAMRNLRERLEGIVFGRCADELVLRTFLYAALDGIVLGDARGGPDGRVVMHGTDTAGRGLVVNASGRKGVELVDTQLVPMGHTEKTAIHVTDGFRGRAAMFATQIWGGRRSSAILEGRGDFVIQEMQTLGGGVEIDGGRASLESASFGSPMATHVRVGAGCREARVLACVSGSGQFGVEAARGARVSSEHNAPGRAWLEARAARASLKVGFEPGERGFLEDTVAQGGGTTNVTGATCRAVGTNSHSGARALRLAGRADSDDHAFAYFKFLEREVPVVEGSLLTYWFRPENDESRTAGVDIVFTDGSNLRDSGAKESGGGNAHPAAARGEAGKWVQVEVPLGRTHAGRTIAYFMFAFDGRGARGGFEAFIDDVAITTE